MTAAVIPRPVREAKPLPEYAVTEKFIDYFWSRVQPDGDCWNWTGMTNASGYGVLHVPSEPYNFQAHRVSYMVVNGPVPRGKVLDHLCFNRACVNPAHLQISDHYANLRRRDPSKQAINTTHCTHGHEYTVENTYITPTGWRQCRVCNQAAVRRYQAHRIERRTGAA